MTTALGLHPSALPCWIHSRHNPPSTVSSSIMPHRQNDSSLREINVLRVTAVSVT